jgi:hypothetical protein
MLFGHQFDGRKRLPISISVAAQAVEYQSSFPATVLSPAVEVLVGFQINSLVKIDDFKLVSLHWRMSM